MFHRHELATGLSNVLVRMAGRSMMSVMESRYDEYFCRMSSKIGVLLALVCATMVAAGCSSSGAGWFGKEEEKKEKNWRARPNERQSESTVGVSPSEANSPNAANAEGRANGDLRFATTPAELRSGQYVPIEVIYVNNDAILAEEVVEPLVPGLREKLKVAGPGDPLPLIVREVAIEVRAQVDNLLMYQEYGRRITEQEQKVIEKVADKEIKNYINKYFGGREARYAKYLEDLGLSLDKVRQRRQRQLVVIKSLQEKYLPMVRPPRRPEMLAYYKSHLGDFQQGSKMELFLIESPFKQSESGANVEQRTAKQIARDHIERAKDELDSGMFFDAVAKKYGTGFLKDRGGLWGVITAPIPQPRWQKASEIVFGLNENEISDIVEGPEGYFIVKCGERVEGQNVSFEQAQPKIERQFRDVQFNRLVAKARHELLRRASRKGDPNGLIMEVTERLNKLLASEQLTKGQ